MRPRHPAGGFWYMASGVAIYSAASAPPPQVGTSPLYHPRLLTPRPEFCRMARRSAALPTLDRGRAPSPRFTAQRTGICALAAECAAAMDFRARYWSSLPHWKAPRRRLHAAHVTAAPRASAQARQSLCWLYGPNPSWGTWGPRPGKAVPISLSAWGPKLLQPTALTRPFSLRSSSACHDARRRALLLSGE